MTVVSSGLCQDSVGPVEEEVKRKRNLVRDISLLVGCFFAQPFTSAVTCFNLNICLSWADSICITQCYNSMALNSKNTKNSEYAELDFTFTNSSMKSYKYRHTNGVLGFRWGQTVDGWENILVKFHVALFIVLSGHSPTESHLWR